jgi:hypothetical protein
MESRHRILRHLGPPAAIALAFAGLYAMPVAVLGCVNRGLVALGLVAVSMVGALVAMGLGVRVFRSRDEAGVWFLTAVALLLPALIVVSVEIVLAS